MPRKRVVGFYRKNRKVRPITGRSSGSRFSLKHETLTEDCNGKPCKIVRGVAKKGNKKLLFAVYSTELLNSIARTNFPEEYVPVVLSPKTKDVVKLPPEKTLEDALKSAEAYASAVLQGGSP